MKLTLRTPAPDVAEPKESVALEPLQPSPLGKFSPFGWLLLLAVGAGLLVGFLPFWSERN